jgi:hypothetical protein
MKNKFSLLNLATLLLCCVFFLSGCEVIQGIFKAGVWVGILIVVGFIALIIFIISRLGGKK